MNLIATIWEQIDGKTYLIVVSAIILSIFGARMGISSELVNQLLVGHGFAGMATLRHTVAKADKGKVSTKK